VQKKSFISVLNYIYGFSILLIFILVGGFSAFIFKKTKMEDLKNLSDRASYLLEGQVPYFAKDLTDKNLKSLEYRAQILEATHAKKELKIFIKKEEDIFIYNNLPMILSAVENQINFNEDVILYIAGGALVVKPIVLGGETVGQIGFYLKEDSLRSEEIFKTILYAMLLAAMGLASTFILMRYFILKLFVIPIEQLVKNMPTMQQYLATEDKKRFFYKENNFALKELDELNAHFKNWVNDLENAIREKNELYQKNETAKYLTIQAKQVAHDIRSPLSALNMVSFTLDQIPEDRRLLIRNAIQRINDIANTLLQKSKTGVNLNEPSTDLVSDENQDIKLKIELLPALMDTIVSEKRVQFRNLVDVNIDIDLASSYGAFVNVDSSSLKRVMSNLINNSVEAFINQSGKVMIKVKNEKDLVLVIISDNGKGIPPEILKKLGKMGVSHGKTGTQSGSGLGLYHAKKTIEIFSGKIQIDSMENQGTTITISLPKATAPDWFVEALVIDPDTRIISVDDDLSIHGIWKGRASSLGVGAHGIEHLSFTSGDNFKKWYFEDQQNEIKLMSVKRHNLFLMDYELLNQSQTGIDLIDELNIADKAVLITSRYEEEKIQERCRHLGLKLIPKTMAGFIPIKITK